MEKVMQPRTITNEEKNYLLSLKEDDVTLELLKEFFAFKQDKPAKFLPNDNFLLPQNKFYNKEQCRTTVGRYIYNLFVLSPKIITLVGYQNETFGGKGIDKLEKKLSDLLLVDKITSKDMMEYFDKMQWLGFSLSRFLNASMTYELVVPTQEIENKKKELIVKYKKAIDSNNLIEINKMEKEIIAFAEEQIKDLPDKQIYDSGSRGSFGNNYKNTSLFRGIIKNLGDNEKLAVSLASLVDGIPPEEMGLYADMITQASYSRAVGTQEGGYEGKKLSAAFQSIILDEDNTDCGTTLTKKVILTDSNKDLFLYRYIVDKNQLVRVDNDNFDKYKNKVVSMRTPLYCKGDKYCNKCAGDLFKMLGIKNVGLVTNRIATTLLNKALKSFHDMSLKVTSINIDDYIE